MKHSIAAVATAALFLSFASGSNAVVETYSAAFCTPVFSTAVSGNTNGEMYHTATTLGRLSCPVIQKAATTTIADWDISVNRFGNVTAVWDWRAWSLNPIGDTGFGTQIIVPLVAGQQELDGPSMGAMSRTFLITNNMSQNMRISLYKVDQ